MGFLLVLVPFIGCEKDDICIAGDTPMLKITFIDATDETTEKAPPGLWVIGKDQTTTVPTLTAGSSSIVEALLPLIPNANETTYYLISNGSIDSEGEIISGNIDSITLSYTTNPIFISKACGYIVHYENLIPILTPDQDQWIKKIEVITPTISNIDAVHLNIYH